jgi:hypothetical protein
MYKKNGRSKRTENKKEALKITTGLVSQPAKHTSPKDKANKI